MGIHTSLPIYKVAYDLLNVVTELVKNMPRDFKADAAKQKWFHHWDFHIDGAWHGGIENRKLRPRDWPRKVWKHYYAMPKDIWKPELAEFLPSKNSGVILLSHSDTMRSGVRAAIERRATPCRDAERIGPADAVDIARLASLRMWDAFDKLEKVAA